MHKVELDARDIKSAPEMVDVNRGVKSLSFGLALLTAATVSFGCRLSASRSAVCYAGPLVSVQLPAFQSISDSNLLIVWVIPLAGWMKSTFMSESKQ